MRLHRCLGFIQFLKLQGDKNEGGKVNGHYTKKTWILRLGPMLYHIGELKVSKSNSSHFSAWKAK